jgi:hypothetical protein
MIQLIDGAAILGYRTNGPNVSTQYGVVPAGIWHSAQLGTGITPFELWIEQHSELVKQAWFAWLIPIGSGSLVVSVSGSGTFTVPQNITSVVCTAVGSGAGGANAGASSSGGGGGGGGTWSSTTLAVSPGDTLTYTVGAGGAIGSAGNSSWISTTNIAPVSTAEGCLANPGGAPFGSEQSSGGPGGDTVSSIGDAKGTAFGGGDGGGSAHPPGNQGGGGAGGYFVGSTNLDTPTNGTNGIGFGTNRPAGGIAAGGDGGANVDATVANGLDGGPGAGGGGGAAIFGSPGTLGSGGIGGDGWISITYQSGTLPTPVITVLEAFGIDTPDDTEYVTVNLPLLSPGAQEALQKLRARYNQENQT